MISSRRASTAVLTGRPRLAKRDIFESGRNITEECANSRDGNTVKGMQDHMLSAECVGNNIARHKFPFLSGPSL